MQTLSLLAMVLVSWAAADDVAAEVKFLTKVEQHRLVANGVVLSRIDRDAEGNVIRLRLDDMQLAAEDWVALEKFEHLLSLSLKKTNVANDDLAHLVRLPSLRWLVISSTELTDSAVDHLAQMPTLRTMCAGDSLISSAAIDSLKTMCPKLVLGHSERK